MSSLEAYSSEDAREEADYHRHELTETLDAIGSKLNRTITSAEDRINKPKNWIRGNPWLAIGIGLAAGFLVARPHRRRDARKATLTRELEAAYLEGRRDEFGHYPLRDRAYWQERRTEIQEALAPADKTNLLLRAVEPAAQVLGSVLSRALTGL